MNEPQDPELFDLEAIYDEQISPLMTQIIAICKEHDLPMLATFVCAQREDDDPLHCTTYIPREGVTGVLRSLYRVVYEQYDAVPSFTAFTITTKGPG